MFKTIKSKFVTVLLVFIIFSFGIPSAFLVYQFRENFKERSEIMLETTLDVMNNCITQSMMNQEKRMQQIIDRNSANPNIEHIRIFDETGLILYSSHETEKNSNIREVEGHRGGNFFGAQRRIEVMEDKRIYSVTEPIMNQAKCQKCHDPNKDIIAYLDVDTHLSKAEIRFYTGSQHFLYLAATLILLLSIGFIAFFTRFINRPLKSVIRAMDKVQAGNLNTRFDVTKDDEFGILQKHFNSMVDHIDKSKQEIEELHFEQLQRADKMVTLGELAAEMAHEINNPAGIIMTRADYLQLEAGDKQELKPFRDDLNVIMKQVGKISRFTGNILKYSKKLPRDFSSVNLTEVIKESLTILEPRLRKNSIVVTKNYQVNNSHIQGDPLQLEQVFTNLINNAIDAIEKNGTITISINSDDENGIKLSFKDDGEGIDEHAQERIFSPFFTTKSAEKGTGLGLYIVKNICKNHGADITCESVPGEGTVFTIMFYLNGKHN